MQSASSEPTRCGACSKRRARGAKSPRRRRTRRGCRRQSRHRSRRLQFGVLHDGQLQIGDKVVEADVAGVGAEGGEDAVGVAGVVGGLAHGVQGGVGETREVDGFPHEGDGTDVAERLVRGAGREAVVVDVVTAGGVAYAEQVVADGGEVATEEGDAVVGHEVAEFRHRERGGVAVKLMHPGASEVPWVARAST